MLTEAMLLSADPHSQHSQQLLQVVSAAVTHKRPAVPITGAGTPPVGHEKNWRVGGSINGKDKEKTKFLFIHSDFIDVFVKYWYLVTLNIFAVAKIHCPMLICTKRCKNERLQTTPHVIEANLVRFTEGTPLT